MPERIDYNHVAPGAIQPMLAMEKYVHASDLEISLLELVKMRASQLNGCGYCLDMHSKVARSAGETEQRLHVLPAWREATFYTDRERAALAWTEAVTLVADSHVPDDAFEQVRAHFGEREIVDLTMAIITINGWNRLAVAFRREVGSYVHPGS
jgi:AhpD family alkylhydroperoxidase